MAFTELADAARLKAAGLLPALGVVPANLAVTAGMYADIVPQASNDVLKAVRNTLVWQAAAQVGASDRDAFLEALQVAFGHRWSDFLMGQMLFSFKKETARVGIEGFPSNANVKAAKRKQRKRRSAAPPSEAAYRPEATPEAPPEMAPAATERAVPRELPLRRVRVKNTFVDDAHSEFEELPSESGIGRPTKSCPGHYAARAASPDPSTAHYALSELEASEAGKASWCESAGAAVRPERWMVPPSGLSDRWIREQECRSAAMATLPGDWNPPNREYEESAVPEVRHLTRLYDQNWPLLLDVVTYHKERAEVAKRLLAPLVHQADVEVASAEVWQDIAHWVGSDNDGASIRARALLTGIVHGPVSLMDAAADSQDEHFLRMVHRSKMDLHNLRPFNEKARRDIADCAARTPYPHTTEALTALASLYAIVLSGSASAVLADRQHWALPILSKVVVDLQETSVYWARREARVTWESLWALAEITQGLTAQEKDELEDLLKPPGGGDERGRILDTAARALEQLGRTHEVLAYREAQRLLNESN